MKKTLSILLMLNLLGIPALAQETTSKVDAAAEARAAEAQAVPPAAPEAGIVTESLAEASARRAAMSAWHAAQRAAGNPTYVTTAQQPARQPVSKEQRRKSFGAVTVLGVITMIVGAGLFIPNGEDFDVFGDKFCVTNEYRTYTDGACSTSDGQKKAAAFVLLTGSAITMVGAVGMKANASKNGFSAGATVKW